MHGVTRMCIHVMYCTCVCYHHVCVSVSFQNGSVGSCLSSTSLSSAKTLGSTVSASSSKHKPSAGNSGAVNEDTFIKAFSDVPQLNVSNVHVHVRVIT